MNIFATFKSFALSSASAQSKQATGGAESRKLRLLPRFTMVRGFEFRERWRLTTDRLSITGGWLGLKRSDTTIKGKKRCASTTDNAPALKARHPPTTDSPSAI
jgi:hypothetical protein